MSHSLKPNGLWMELKPVSQLAQIGWTVYARDLAGGLLSNNLTFSNFFQVEKRNTDLFPSLKLKDVELKFELDNWLLEDWLYRTRIPCVPVWSTCTIEKKFHGDLDFQNCETKSMLNDTNRKTG